jgi:hypothetical protein
MGRFQLKPKISWATFQASSKLAKGFQMSHHAAEQGQI